MARIEYRGVEPKMEELRGFCKFTPYDEKNPYTTDKLHDDDFNFISGANFVLGYLTEAFAENLDDYAEDEDSLTIQRIKKELAVKTLSNFAEYGYRELEEMITSAIESYEDED